MAELVFTIVALALLGSLGVPLVIFILARFGYFEPIRFELFGRAWSFAPKVRISTAFSNAAFLVFPARQAMFASAVTTILTINVPNLSVSLQDSVSARSAATGLARDV
jgi:hypothetical protein